MKEINFYLIDGDLEHFFYSFLFKLMEKDKKSVIYMEDSEKLDRFDNYLWCCKKTEFLPHAVDSDKFACKTPICLTSKKQNINNANFLFIENFVDDDFLDSFEKIFYVIEKSNSVALDNSRKSWKNYKNKNYNLKLFKKDDAGKWIESIELS